MAATSTPDSPASRFKEEVRATTAAFLHLARTRLCTVRTVAVCLFGGVFLLQVFFALYLNYFSSTESQPALLEKKLLSDSSGKQTQPEGGGDLHGGLGAGLGLETPGGGAHTSRPGAALSQMAWQMGRSMFAQWLRFGHDQQQVDCISTGAGSGDGPSGGGGERKEVNLDSPAAGGLGLLSDDGDDVVGNRPSTKVAGSADKSASTSQVQSGAAETTGSAAAERTKPKGDYSHEPELSDHAPGAQGVANHDEGGRTTATARNSKQPRTTTNRDPKIDYVNSGDAAHTGGSRINFNDIAEIDPDKRKLLVSLISPHSDRGEVVKHICSVLWTLPQGKRTEKPFPTQTTPQRAMGAARRLAARGLTSRFQEHEVLAEMRRRERHTQDEAALYAFADAEEGSRSDRKSSNLESWARVDSKIEQLETIGRASFRVKYPLLATAAAAADVTSGHLGSFARALMESLRPAVRHLMGAVAGTETEGAGEERRLEGVTFSAEDAAVDGADSSRLRDPAQPHGNRSERKLQRQATEEEEAHAVEIPVFDPREASAKKGSAASVQKELDESGKLWRDPSGGVHYIVYLIPPHRASAADARIGLDGAHQGGGGLKWVTKPPRGGGNGKAGRRRLGAAEQSAPKPPDTTPASKSDGEESAITRYAQLVRLFEEIRQVSNHILFDLCGPPVFAGLRRLSDLSFVYDSDVLLPQLIRAKLPNVDHVAVLTEKMFVQSGDIFQDLHTVKEYGSGVSLVPEAVNVNEEASERVGKSRRAGQNRMSSAELGRLAREVRVDSLLTNQLEWMTEEATKAVDHRGVGSRRQLSTTAAGGSKLNSEYGVDPGFSYYHSQHYAYSDYEDNIFVWGPRSASGKSSAASVGPESRVSSRKSSWAKCVVEADRGSLTFLDPHAAEQEQEGSGSGGTRSSPPAQLTSTPDLAASTADDVVEISSSLAFLFGRTPEVLRYLHGLDFLLERCGSYVFSQAADAGRATIDGMHSRLLRYFAHHPVPGADLIWAEPAGYLFGMSWSSKQIRSTDPAPLYLQYPLLYNGLSNFGQHLRSESIRVGPCKIFRQTKNVDIRGSDLPGPTAASAKVDIVACQAACNAEHDCDTFVWLPANKMCYLKTRARLATPTEKQGLILAQCTHERT